VKSTKYTRFCRRLLSNTFERFDIGETSKNRLLEKADINIVYKEYYSMVLMNITIGFIAAFISTVIFYMIVPHDITALFILIFSSQKPGVKTLIGIFHMQPTLSIPCRSQVFRQQRSLKPFQQ